MLPQSSTIPKRAVFFFDGQNLFHAAREAFGYQDPNFDPILLSEAISKQNNWDLVGIRLYTGVPPRNENEYRHLFWAAKARFLGRDKRVFVFTRNVQYRSKPMYLPHARHSHSPDAARLLLPDGSPMPPGTELFLPEGRAIPGKFIIRLGEEKGIDVRIAVDLIRLTYRNEFDVAVVFSQDQDLSEAIREVIEIAKDQKRFVGLYSAFPVSSRRTYWEPIDNTNSIEIDQPLYDACLDRHDFRPKPKR